MSHNSSDGLWSLRRLNDWKKIWMKKLNGGIRIKTFDWLAVPIGHPDSGSNWEHNLSFPANPTVEHWQASCLMPLFLQRRQEWMWLAQSVALRKGCSAVIQLLFVHWLHLNRKWAHGCQIAPWFQPKKHFCSFCDALTQSGHGIQFEICERSKVRVKTRRWWHTSRLYVFVS